MNLRIKQLRDLVVALDLADRKLQPLPAVAYQAAARNAMRLTRDEMGLLPMSDFAGPANSLQNIAENIYFSSNRCFADLDGSGRAGIALRVGSALIERMRGCPEVVGHEIAECLFTRLRAAPAAMRPAMTPAATATPPRVRMRTRIASRRSLGDRA